jgi:hypothetical protein
MFIYFKDQLRKLQDAIQSSMEKSNKDELSNINSTPVVITKQTVFENNDENSIFDRDYNSDDNMLSEDSSDFENFDHDSTLFTQEIKNEPANEDTLQENPQPKYDPPKESEEDIDEPQPKDESESVPERNQESVPERKIDEPQPEESEDPNEKSTAPVDNDLRDVDLESESETDSQAESIPIEEAMILKENEKTTPSIVHEHSGKKFYYLSQSCDESEHLMNQYDKDISEEGINIALYLYTICDSNYITPFISVLQKYTNDNYDFPQFRYIPEIHNKEDEHHYHNHILEHCLRQLYTIFDIKPTEGTNSDIFHKRNLCYKGYLELDADNIVMVIDVSSYLNQFQDFEIQLSKLFLKGTNPPELKWVIIDELTKKLTDNIPIAPVFTDFLLSENHSFLKTIQIDGKTITNPKLLYNCTIEDNKFNTILNKTDNIKLIAELAQHPQLGQMYFFSDKIISNESMEIDTVNRYVVYVQNVKVIQGEPTDNDTLDEDTESIEEEEDVMDVFEDKPKSKPEKISNHYDCIQFENNGNTIYGLKSSTFFCIL